MSATSLTGRIAMLNDQLRARVGLPAAQAAGDPQGLAVITQGILLLTSEQQAEVLHRVRTFDAFDEGNDPYGEHDFGSFALPGVGTVLWKIDTYADRTCTRGSEDPADPSRSFRVITIMRADEY